MIIYIVLGAVILMGVLLCLFVMACGKLEEEEEREKARKRAADAGSIQSVETRKKD